MASKAAVKATRKTNIPASGVIAVLNSGNAKIGLMSATYASQKTCPRTCPLLGAGCYAETGFTNFSTARVNAAAIDDLLEIAANEAQEINDMPAINNLRVHVVGDCSTPEAARLVGAAMVDFDRRGKRRGVKSYTYTHAWRDVDIADWRGASVLASCQNTEEVKEANGRGYNAAVIVDSFPSPKMINRDGVKIIPCPSQVSGGTVTCNDCMLCGNAETLTKKGLTVGFAAHGPKKSAVITMLHAVDYHKVEDEGETEDTSPESYLEEYGEEFISDYAEYDAEGDVIN